MKKYFLVILIVLAIIPPVVSQDSYLPQIVSVNKTPQILAKIRKLDLDLLMEEKGRIYIVAGPAELVQLEQENIPFTMEKHRFPARSQDRLASLSSVNGAFHSYQEVEQELMEIESAYQHIARRVIIGSSIEGRNITAIKISDNPELNEDEAEVVFFGCHHAREWISVEVPLLLAKHLTEAYTKNERIKTIVDSKEIWIVPLVNPDGLEYSIHVYRYWRKNRRDNGDGTFGVDLNRNYGYMWGIDDTGSNPNPISFTYRGPAPFSEPESCAVRDLVAAHNFSALISFHNYSQVILYPWGFTDQPAPNNKTLEELARMMVDSIEQVHGRKYAYGQGGAFFYPTNGGTVDWALGEYNIPAFTVELPPTSSQYGGFFNAEEDIRSIFEENLAAALSLLEWAAEPAKTDLWIQLPIVVVKLFLLLN